MKVMKSGVQGEGGRTLRMVLVALVALWVSALFAEGAFAIAPQINGVKASGIGAGQATLEAQVNPQGKQTRWHFEFGISDCATSACMSIPTPEVTIPAGSSPVPVEVSLEGLAPDTIYHYRLVATNGDGKTTGADHVFATRGTPSTGLPDARGYEQSSPVDKDGGDAVGKLGLVKAADGGGGITFQSTFGIPGGKGAQALPTYLAMRGSGGWSTQGLLPPPLFGERAQMQGWLPDLSETFTGVAKLETPRLKALLMQSTTGGPATVVGPYTPNAEYSYAGTNPDASIVFFESPAKLAPIEGEQPITAAIQGKPNLYAWDRSSGRLSLAGVLNDGKAPPKGTRAGPYGWSRGTDARTLSAGGAASGAYLEGTHSITTSGDIYFTEGGTGQLYLRLNPTNPQSDLDGEGKCIKAEDACTIHVSASQKDNGQGPNGTDSVGAQPAAFQAASADGSEAFFASSEKLTNDANTGPEQPAPAIGTGNVVTGVVEDATFIPKRAVGIAVDSEHVYWADPIGERIGRADLDGDPNSIEDDFIVPGQSGCEFEVEGEPGVFEPIPAPSKPRYLAVDAAHIYWTNTGVLKENGEPLDGGGTIGRADLNGESPDPDFICGASNPQGVATNATHVYWANAAINPLLRSIGRATIGGGEVQQEFFSVDTSTAPYGVALSASHVYFSLNEDIGDNGFVSRLPLEGGTEEFLGIGKAGLRGVAVSATQVYWATQGEEAIGVIPLSDFPPLGGCETIGSCDKEFLKPAGKLFGLAASSSHLYWSVNGEAPSNPGSDLYRYEPSTDALEDLTPLPAGNGAEVQGVLGASEDGSRVYFAANGDLDGAGSAAKGTCSGIVVSQGGSCNIYLWQDGAIGFVGRVKGSDSLDWTGTPEELFATAGYTPKTAFVSKDGEVLLFRSQEKLTPYDNEGVSELYRYSASDGKLACVSCPPSGEAVGKGPKLGSIGFPGSIAPALAGSTSVASRNLSADGSRAFFETAEALVPADTNGEGGCPFLISTPACLDVYEWEAPGKGSCSEGGAAWSPLNEGCVYLISTGKSPFPSLFADASETGDDVFFFTREGLVGQDTDELQDVYDARVGGGLAAQNPPPPNPCLSTESCHGAAPGAPSEQSAGSATFVGPGNEAQKHKKGSCPKGKVRRGGKCVKKKAGKPKHRKSHQRASGNGGQHK